MKFNIIDEKFEFKEGNVLAIFTLDDNPTEYILYSVDDYGHNESKILISHLIRGESSNDTIEPIQDIEEQHKVIKAFKDKLTRGDTNE